MPKAMIISVGGTVEPIIKAVCEYKPEFVSFLASQDTSDLIKTIKDESAQKGVVIKSELTLLEDVNDLLHCYSKAEVAVQRIITKAYDKHEVLVDYTGGTKNMSVALALAAVTHGFSFSYVGGTQRTKNGMGIVENGHEKIYRSINPWDFLAIAERHEIALLFNKNQFLAAAQLANLLAAKTTKNKTMYKQFAQAIDGYYSWDLFRHKEAHTHFERAKLEELSSTDDSPIRSFAEATSKLLPFLEETISDSRDGKRPCLAYIIDLYANAERRRQEGKIDDAILRLYRLVEMAEQERLLSGYSINTASVAPEKIPPALKEPYQKKYMDDRDKKIKIPQNAGFELLAALADPMVIQFQNERPSFRNIQSSRNQSYLAHGFESAKEKTYTDLRNFIRSLNLFKDEDIPAFPKL